MCHCWYHEQRLVLVSSLITFLLIFICHRDEMETLIKHSRPRVEIDLAKQRSGFVPSYTTWDSIDGTATAEVDRDTDFDSVEITLEG